MTSEISCIPVSCCVCGNDHSASYSSGKDFEYDTVREEFEFRQCTDCGHVYLTPRPAPESLSVIYPSSYYAYDLNQSVNSYALKIKHALEKRKLSKLLRYCSEPEPRCLDIGCGDGRILDLLANHGIPKDKIEGTELCESIAERLREKGFRGYTGKIEDLQLDEGAYHFILLFQVIEHVENPGQILQKIFHCLAPGGILVVETPNVRSLDARVFKKRYWGGYHFPRHWNLFSRQTLIQLGERIGYEAVAAETFVCAVFWIYSIHHYFKDKGYPKLVSDFFWPLSNPALLVPATALDMLLAPFGLTSNLRIIFKKR